MRELKRAASRRTFRNEPVGESEQQRFLGIDPSPSQDQIGRSVQPDPARQKLGAPFAGNQAEPHLGESEGGCG